MGRKVRHLASNFPNPVALNHTRFEKEQRIGNLKCFWGRLWLAYTPPQILYSSMHLSLRNWGSSGPLKNGRGKFVESCVTQPYIGNFVQGWWADALWVRGGREVLKSISHQIWPYGKWLNICNTAADCEILLKSDRLVHCGRRNWSRERLTSQAASSGNASSVATWLASLFLFRSFYCYTLSLTSPASPPSLPQPHHHHTY